MHLPRKKLGQNARRGSGAGPERAHQAWSWPVFGKDPGQSTAAIQCGSLSHEILNSPEGAAAFSPGRQPRVGPSRDPRALKGRQRGGQAAIIDLAPAIMLSPLRGWKFCVLTHPGLAPRAKRCRPLYVPRSVGSRRPEAQDSTASEDGRRFRDPAVADRLPTLRALSSGRRRSDNLPGRPNAPEASELVPKIGPPPSSSRPWSIRGLEPAYKVGRRGYRVGGPGRESTSSLEPWETLT